MDSPVERNACRVPETAHSASLFFMTLSYSLMTMPLAALVAGCAGARTLVPEKSNLAEVHAKLGNPTDIRFDKSGGELWEYARGPMGTETYLIRAAGDGRVTAVTQLLTEAQFNKIVPGKMTKADVRDLLGRPSDEAFLYNGTSWTWRVDLKPPTGQFVVRFDAKDVVLDKIILFDLMNGGNNDHGGGRGGGGK